MTLHLIDALLAVALIVVVPSAMRLLGRGRPVVIATAGAVSTGSFFVGEGLLAASLVLPWLLATAVIAHRATLSFAKGHRPSWPMALSAVYLFGGACWLAVSRYGARPLGFSNEIVELTAVHFHYAGFVAPLVMDRLRNWLGGAGSRYYKLARTCEYGVLAATPITAAGITVSAALGAAGSMLFGLALTTGSILTVAVVFPRIRGAGSYLLVISSISVVVTMMLAVSYALGRWLPTPAPSLTTMVWTHGLLNAFGFALCGVFGWVVVSRGTKSTTQLSA